MTRSRSFLGRMDHKDVELIRPVRFADTTELATPPCLSFFFFFFLLMILLFKSSFWIILAQDAQDAFNGSSLLLLSDLLTRIFLWGVCRFELVIKQLNGFFFFYLLLESYLNLTQDQKDVSTQGQMMNHRDFR